MDPLPTLRMDDAHSELAGWARLAGFPVEGLAPDPPPIHPEGAPLTRVALPPPGAGATPRFLLVPRDDWREALGTVFRELSLSPADLQLHQLCPCCGDRLLTGGADELAPDLAPHLELRPESLRHCPRCDPAAWPGEDHQDRSRQLQEVLLEFAFRCARCGETDGARRGRNLARLEVRCNLGPLEISQEELELDPSDEILRLLALLEKTPQNELEDSVAFHRNQPLCSPCRRQLVELLRGFFRGPVPGSPPCQEAPAPAVPEEEARPPAPPSDPGTSPPNDPDPERGPLP